MTRGNWVVACSVVIACAGLAGCTANPLSHTAKTTVVLMPDDNGKTGEVSVSTASGTQVLNEALSHTIVEHINARPAQASPMPPETLRRDYGGLLKLHHPTRQTFTVHFLLDKTELTAESKAVLPSVYAAIGQRKPASVMVLGHADATGSQQWNMKLSADRAEAVANLLRLNDPSLEDVDVQFFGEMRPLPQSGNGASEANNRRVEILIH